MRIKIKYLEKDRIPTLFIRDRAISAGSHASVLFSPILCKIANLFKINTSLTPTICILFSPNKFYKIKNGLLPIKFFPP